MPDDDAPPIPGDRVPDDEGDELPEDLDVTAYVGPYLFPTMERRRIPATMYLVLAALCLVGWLLSSNGGLLGAAIFLALVAAYHYASRLAADHRPDGGVADRLPHRRLRGRSLERAAGLARLAGAAGLAHPPLQRRVTAGDARPGADRRGRRHGDGGVHRTEPRGLVEVRRSTKPQVNRSRPHHRPFNGRPAFGPGNTDGCRPSSCAPGCPVELSLRFSNVERGVPVSRLLV